MEARKRSSSFRVMRELQNPSTSSQILAISDQDIANKKEIGQGAVSTVFLAEWQARQVVVKTFTKKKQSAVIEYTNEKKIYEALAASRNEADKPYTVKLFGYINRPTYCLVMEYAIRGSLASHLDNTETKPFAWQIRRNIMKDIARGIRFLHGEGILHRDIKSDNVVLDENMRAKLCDFNYSIHEVEQKKAEKVGTIEYLPPEIVLGLRHRKQSDIFSFSQLMCELSMWKLPFQHVIDDEEVHTCIRTGKFDDIPAETPAIIAKLITRGRKLRQFERPCIEEMIKELDADSILSPPTPQLK